MSSYLRDFDNFLFIYSFFENQKNTNGLALRANRVHAGLSTHGSNFRTRPKNKKMKLKYEKR